MGLFLKNTPLHPSREGIMELLRKSMNKALKNKKKIIWQGTSFLKVQKFNDGYF
jgi:hypothetical protein